MPYFCIGDITEAGILSISGFFAGSGYKVNNKAISYRKHIYLVVVQVFTSMIKITNETNIIIIKF